MDAPDLLDVFDELMEIELLGLVLEAPQIEDDSLAPLLVAGLGVFPVFDLGHATHTNRPQELPRARRTLQVER